MKTNKIRLYDLLMLFVHPSTTMMQYNRINTNNDSFPEKYRSSSIGISSLFADILRNKDDYLFEKYIDYIVMLPVNHKVTDTKFNKPVVYDFANGFIDFKIDEATGEQYKVPIAGILHVVLETD